MSAPLTSGRLAYDDLTSPADMRADCVAVQASLTQPLAAAASRLSQEQPKRAEIEISEAAARLAGAIYGE
jgi:hypothetical protein